ncbi:hypothetical protein PR202_ga04143 [Eleusine coracana subsp. coracana]|uniref:GDSL esterase/lipase n=1 Tax=Eleusine coracana subsp. coracana TaxID=191504 RepID=A0AAV5BPJ9_ELECO|nr:hypothetical protein PR202_ga04143 [Eleusine coracana subsp. coracana]
MKKNIVLLALCLLIILVLNGGHHVEGRRSHHPKQPPMLLVFGDSFVDAGNIPKTAMSVVSRGWHYPYGMSSKNRATGRLSDGKVQSDFVAKIMGLDESPPPLADLGQNDDDDVDPSGINFAVGGTGALMGTPSLAQQVDQLDDLLKNRTIRDRDLKDSVALISIAAGGDYSDIKGRNGYDQMTRLSRRVTEEMRKVVKRLLDDVGVSKVIVNTMAPMGCTPWESARNNHAHCESQGNTMSDVHNAALRQKMAAGFRKDEVLLLDLNHAFNTLLQGQQDQFTSGLNECCVASKDGYCGQVDNRGQPMYGLCRDPEQRFYWDYIHPTQAAWKAVMDILRDPVKDFLGNDDDY